MNPLTRLKEIIVGRSVVDLAQAVDDALIDLHSARGLVSACENALQIAQADVIEAERRVASARDALFKEHPDLVPSKVVSIPDNLPADISPGAFMQIPDDSPSSAWDPTPIEVDDDNDPWFTAGGSPAPSADDNEPLPEIVWEERDE